MKTAFLILSLFLSSMAHAPRNIQAPNVAADFWAQWNSTNPRMALFVKITPKADWTGASALGFTSNSRNMTLPGHPGITFYSSPGITPTIVEQSLGETSTLELSGVYQTSIFERSDVLAGKYSFATVEVFSASWQDTDLGELLHFKGTVGEFKDYGTYFTAEGRGLIGQLSVDVSEVTQRTCRVKVFGNARCKKVLTGSFTYDATSDVTGAVISETAHGMTTGEVIYPSVVSGTINPQLTAGSPYYVIRDSADAFKLATTYANSLTGTAITLTDSVGEIRINRGVVVIGGVAYNITQTSVDGNPGSSVEGVVFDTSTFDGNDPADSTALGLYAPYFKNGTITALDGPNAGITREISNAAESTGGHPFMTVYVKRSFPFEIDTTTSFDLQMGCDRTMEKCREFVNAINFAGEPYVPGIESANRITSGN